MELTQTDLKQFKRLSIILLSINEQIAVAQTIIKELESKLEGPGKPKTRKNLKEIRKEKFRQMLRTKK